MNTSPRRALPTAFLFLLTAALTAFPQDLDNATLSGKILDPNRAAVRGAIVHLTAIESGFERTISTDENGHFRFVTILDGVYLLRIHASGFEDRVTTSFELKGATDINIDLILQPKTILAEQYIESSDVSESFIEGARPAVGGSIGKEVLSLLPNVRSDVLALALLFGGASEESLSTRDLSDDSDSNPRSTPLEQGLMSLGGGTSYSNNLTVDGFDNNDDRTSRERFVPPLDSVAELQIMRNQFSAEYGRASGGRINVVTKSGGRRLRGTLALSGRDERMNANTWFNNSRGLSRAMLREREASLFINGPLCASGCARKANFAATLEMRRTGDTTLIDTFVPVVGNPRFRLPDPNGNDVFCEAQEAGACSGEAPSGTLISPYTSLLATPNLVRHLHIRTDARPLAHTEISIGLQIGRSKLQRTSTFSVGKLKEAVQSRLSSTNALNLSVVTHGERYSNQIRLQLSEFLPGFAAGGREEPVLVIAFRNPYTGASSNLVAGNSTASTLQNFAESRVERRLQVQDTATIVAGPHIVKFGGEIQSIDSAAKALTDATGTFNFANMLNFTRGNLSRFRQNFGTRADVQNMYSGIFLNDELRVSEGLNVTFGIRYELETAVEDLDNFGPRIALALDPKGDGFGVIRMGAGIFYNRLLLRTVGDFARSRSSLLEFDTNQIGVSGSDSRRMSVLAAIATRFPRSFSSVKDLRALINSTMCGSSPCSQDLGFSYANSASLPSRRIAPHIRIPQSRQFNVGYERRIGSGLTISADFSVNATRRLWREYDANASVIPGGFVDWTQYLLTNPFIFENSNGTRRTYVFYLGAPTDPSVSSQPGGGSNCSTTANIVCHVNLNSVSASTTSPSTSTADTSNSIGSPLGIALTAISRFRPDPTLGRLDTIDSLGHSVYRGLVVEVRAAERSLALGLKGTLRVSYTLSSQKDDGLNNTSNAEVNGDFEREWARSLQDRRHRVNFFGTLKLPTALGGLTASPTLRFGSAAPFNIGTGADRNLDGSSTDRPSFDATTDMVRWRRSGSEFPSALHSRFSLPAIGSRSGTLRRNSGIGPRLFVLDVKISRDFKPTERLRLRPNLEIGNVLNAAVFSYGAEYIDFSPIGSNPTAAQLAVRDRFLVPTRALRPREMRVGMKVEF